MCNKEIRYYCGLNEEYSDCKEGNNLCCYQCDKLNENVCDDYCVGLVFSSGLSKEKQSKYVIECEHAVIKSDN